MKVVVGLVLLAMVMSAVALEEAGKPKKVRGGSPPSGWKTPVIQTRKERGLIPKYSHKLVIVPKGDTRAYSPVGQADETASANVVADLAAGPAGPRPTLQAANGSGCTAKRGVCKAVSSCTTGNIQSGLCPGGSNIKCCLPRGTTTAPTTTSEAKVMAVAKAIMSEASIGNEAEQIAIGYASQRNSKHATNQTPTAKVIALARKIVNKQVADNSRGATHWYSPRSMPKEGGSTKGFDVGGGLERVTGMTVRNYKPKWAAGDKGYLAISGVRPAYYKFFKL